MMLDNLKPIGAFVENTIRPMMEEATKLAGELGRYDIIPNRDIPKILRGFFILQIVSILAETIKTILCTAIIGYVAWMIAQ